MEILQQLAEGVIAGEEEDVVELTRNMMEAGLTAKEILDEGLLAGMAVVGECFKAHDIFLPDVLLAAKAMTAGLELLKPLMRDQGVRPRGKVVVGTVPGDLHDIGKNLVAIMLKGVGFEVIDLGNDVAPERFVAAAQEHAAPIIGLSALLTTTMPVMQQVVDRVREEGLGDRVKVIVGGAPVSQEFAERIGADAYGFDAANAVDRVKALTGAA
ncbi:MAG: cobalamin-binding protein [bacterium]|nr:cobalamin-binding protein [bacterium]